MPPGWSNSEDCRIFDAAASCLTSVVHPGEYVHVDLEILNLTEEEQHFHAFLRLVRCDGVEKPWRKRLLRAIVHGSPGNPIWVGFAVFHTAS